MGHANHFLITLLIGLDSITRYNVSKPNDFSTSWNPRNKKHSVDRSREYALNASLAWSIDCLDGYFNSCNLEPKIIDKSSFISELDSANRSVNEKFKIFSKNYLLNNRRAEIPTGIVALAIQWRNNTTHSNAQNNLEQHYTQVLKQHKEDIKVHYCNLDIEQTLDNFKNKKSPTFKEVATIIKATQEFVELIDQKLISELDINKNALNIIEHFFKRNPQEKILFKTLMPERQIRKISNILLNNSYSCSNSNNDNGFEVDLNEILKKMI